MVATESIAVSTTAESTTAESEPTCVAQLAMTVVARLAAGDPGALDYSSLFRAVADGEVPPFAKFNHGDWGWKASWREDSSVLRHAPGAGLSWRVDAR